MNSCYIPMLSNAYSYKTNMERLEALHKFMFNMVFKLPLDLVDKFKIAYSYVIGDITQKCSVSRSMSDKRNLRVYKQPELDFNETIVAHFQNSYNTLFGCFDLELYPRRFDLIKTIVLDSHGKDGDECYKSNQIDIAINNHIYDYSLYCIIIECLNLFDFHMGSNKSSYFGSLYLDLLKLKQSSVDKMNSLALFSSFNLNIERIKAINLFENFLHFVKDKPFDITSDAISMSYKSHLNHEYDDMFNPYYSRAMKDQFEVYRKLFHIKKYRDACIQV